MCLEIRPFFELVSQGRYFISAFFILSFISTLIYWTRAFQTRVESTGYFAFSSLNGIKHFINTDIFFLKSLVLEARALRL